MTTRQENFIESLLNRKNTEGINHQIDLVNWRYMSTEDASILIDALLGCPDKTSAQINRVALEARIYKVVSNKKSAKNAAIYKQIKEIIGRYPTKITEYTDEQLAAIAAIL